MSEKSFKQGKLIEKSAQNGPMVYGVYPYPTRGRDLNQRENLAKGSSVPRILRGGAFDSYEDLLRCTYRLKNYPNLRLYFVGFRVAVTSF